MTFDEKTLEEHEKKFKARTLTKREHAESLAEIRRLKMLLAERTMMDSVEEDVREIDRAHEVDVCRGGVIQRIRFGHSHLELFYSSADAQRIGPKLAAAGARWDETREQTDRILDRPSGGNGRTR